MSNHHSINSIYTKTNSCYHCKNRQTIWKRKYLEFGEESLENQKKPGNPLCKYSNKKNLSKEEQLEYENMKLRIENELLKKGYLMKGDGTIVKFTK